MSTLEITIGRPGWLRSPRFDLTLIVGVALLALGAGAAVVLRPEWFVVLLILDLWLLGYPHVVSTFTRLAFDAESLRQNRFLVFGLPLIVLGGTLALGSVVGSWAVATTYLYWQWFHYTRQSYGVMRYYSRRIGPRGDLEQRVETLTLYLVPLWGILHRSWQAPDRFIDMEVRYLPTPEILVEVVGMLAVASVLVWAWFQVMGWRQREMAPALALYVLSHCVITFVAYISIDDITSGWLVINVWHNAQYLLIVWMYNANRFRGGIEPQHRFLSGLSQGRFPSILRYCLFCFGVSTVVYLGISFLVEIEYLAAIPVASVVAYQTINFHHYVVDGLIWKRRRRSVPLAPATG